jgi:hypothetical protein
VLRNLILLAAVCFSTSGFCDEPVPVPADTVEKQKPPEEFSPEEFLQREFGVVLKDDPLSIVENLDERNVQSEPFTLTHRIIEVSSRTWSSKTNRYTFDKKHRVGSMAKLASVLKSKQFQNCTIIDFKLTDAEKKPGLASFMRLSELEVKRGSALQTDVPFGVAPSIRAN